MIFQLISDVHLEFVQSFHINKTNADCLLLAGDIGEIDSLYYKDFIKQTSQNYNHVFIIKGNHECFGHTLQEADAIINEIVSEYTNVHYLNKSGFNLKNNNGNTIRIIGCTLWSKIEKKQQKDIQLIIQDYRQIKDWSIERMAAEHLKDVAFIQTETEQAKKSGYELIVMTHHAPSNRNTSRQEHQNSPIFSSYSSDCEFLFQKPIVAWVFGHTHHSCQTTFDNGIHLYSNQVGYKRENTGYKSDFVFTI